MAVDETDSIYIADYGNSKIMNFNKEMKLVKEVSVQDSQLWGVAIVGDEVMVCDYVYGCVMVYTEELEYVRQLDSPDNNIYDVSSDEHGNLYVSDAHNHHIQVLSNGGEYLYSISCDGNKFNYPLGVYVSGQYVYVADNSNHKVSVYTTMGGHVTTLGQKGINEGDFRFPWGVCTDKDGYVYVCDSNNNRVQIITRVNNNNNIIIMAQLSFSH